MSTSAFHPDPSHQLSTIRPLVTSLVDSTLQSSTLSQAQNELSLLVAVLGATQEYSSLCTDFSRPLAKTLQNCYSSLLDLQRLGQLSSDAEPQNRILNLRARFSSLIFELSVMNADMTISSQRNVDRSMRGFIDDIHAGKRDASVVSNLLSETASDTEKDDAWNQLQRDLHTMGIPPELSSRDHTFILATLQNAVDSEDLLKNIRQQPDTPIIPFMPPTSIPQHHTQLANASHPRPMPPPRSRDLDYSDKEVFSPENLPIPVVTELQDTADWAKHAVPVPASDLPIPIASEIPSADDSDKQALPRENYPIPVESEIPRPDDADKQVLPRDNYPIPVATETSSDTLSNSGSAASNSSITSRGKKPSIVSRMKFKLTKNKEEFITLIQMGGLYSVKLALDKGADPNTFNIQGHTALMVAASFGHEDIVELLLEWGALPNKVSNTGDTALGSAAARGYEGIVFKLLARGAGVDFARGLGKTALSQAAERGQEKIVRALLDRGADINALSHTGDTALSQAVQGGHINVVRLLLDCGARVDWTSYPRKTPLFKAVEENRLEVAKLLMERGADPTLAESVRRRSPWSLASTNGQREYLTLFKQYGYDPTRYQFC